MVSPEQKQLAQNIGDIAAGAVTIGIFAELVPVIVGILTSLWFILRGINWYRVNFMDKEPWKGM